MVFKFGASLRSVEHLNIYKPYIRISFSLLHSLGVVHRSRFESCSLTNSQTQDVFSYNCTYDHEGSEGCHQHIKMSEA